MLTLMNLIIDLLLKHWQLGLGLKGMGKFMSKPKRNRAMNLTNPPWILVNVVSVPIEIDESHVIPAGSQAI